MVYRKALILFLFLFTFLEGFSQINKQLMAEREKQVKNYTVPNGIWLYGNTFMDETEIANIHWLEYLYYIKNDSSEEYAAGEETFNDSLKWSYLPDQLVFYWPRMADKAQVLVYLDHYLRYPGFRYYPLVGITYDQAVNYSKWRSAIVSSNKNKELIAKGSDYRVYMHFRLPTNEEWEFAAQGLLDKNKFPYGLTDTTTGYDKELYDRFYRQRENARDSLGRTYKRYRNKTPDSLEVSKQDYKSIYRRLPELRAGAPTREAFEKYRRPAFSCNYTIPIHPGDSRKLVIQGINFPANMYSNTPNQLSFYNMTGNVAEMIAEPGIAKGGSWIHMPEECKISNRISYACPTEWLGFRNACDVYEYHKDSVPVVVNQLQKKWSNCAMVQNRALYNLRYDTSYQKPLLKKFIDSISALPHLVKVDQINSGAVILAEESIIDFFYNFKIQVADTNFHISEITTSTMKWPVNLPTFTTVFKSDVEYCWVSDRRSLKDLYYVLISIKGTYKGEEKTEIFCVLVE